MKKLPLEGIRVLDITLVWAGPFATQVLADWGAEVIRVESIQHIPRSTRIGPADPFVSSKGDWWTAYPNRDPGDSPWNRWNLFNLHARNKKSVTIDLRTEEGREIFMRLVQVSDVFLENNVPETIEKLGLTYEELRKVKTDIIMVRMPGFGLDGPYKNYRMFGNHAEAAVGHINIRGYADRNLTDDLTTVISDALGGLNAAVAALMALRHRRRTGKGQLVELSQSEGLASYLPHSILDYTMNRRVHKAMGNRHHSMAPHGCYPCRGEDRWVTIAVSSDEEWKQLCQAMDYPALADDPRYSTILSRYRNQDELDQLISQWTKQRDSYEVMELLQRHGVASGPVIDDKDAFSDPHIKAREFFKEITHAECGTHLYPGFMWKSSRHDNEVRIPPCRLGEHNEYVYKELLGYSQEQYERLEREGRIGTGYVAFAPADPVSQVSGGQTTADAD